MRQSAHHQWEFEFNLQMGYVSDVIIFKLCAMPMKETIKLIPLLGLGLLSALSLSDKIRFGHGMGDILYYLLIHIGLIAYLIYYFIKIGDKPINLITPSLFILFTGYLILKMTIWRGPEYSWDGNIFVESNKKMNIENQIKIN